MKRKSTAIVAALAAVALGAAACGSDTDSGGTTAGGAKDGNYKLAFVQGVAGDAFYITMECGIKEEAAKEGATVTTQGAQKFDPTLQTPVLQSVIASKPDAILIAPTDVSAMQQPIAQAKAQGIKIVLVDTTLNDPSVAVSAISSDNTAGGKAAFEAIQKLAPNGGKVLGVGVQPGISTTDARDKGFADAAKADSKFTYLGVQYSQNDPAKAASIVSAALQKDPDIVGIFASNLFSAQGSATGIRQAGKQGKVNVVGFDAGPEQIKALQDGTVQALIAQQPGDIGVQGVQQAIKALKGESNEAKIQTGSTIITKDTIDSAEGKAAAYKASC
ncbi:ribose ABC transporter substrate-binding protein [Asanoa ishikariensis]|uniref:Monosaccharide ABC transporter substrate-binding protein, CUT2 family n=1 Tax=Asanoa ishikariensis TaxID=137265 RepID=A0A1H3UGD8_9ACTN|nr:ABC transporter substrate-binding protein [Asanoa ishikariensis]GIF63609.1 ribose ABC transporter substrate-binding protein [Asanoa ishikariensis]SDZ61347.1 monosaccharide ABC transporter substrate-binding protein, CUT2 family [Asanoa ishikariensis]